MPYFVAKVAKDGKQDVRRKCPVCNIGAYRYQGLLSHLRQDHHMSRREAEALAKADKNAAPLPFGRAKVSGKVD